MITVRYIPVADRVSTFSVILVSNPLWLVGIIYEVDGKWTARLRSDPMCKAVAGWRRRSDAARYLLIVGKFCRDPEDFRAVAA